MRLMRWTHPLLALGLTACAPPPVAIDAIAEGYVRVSLQLAQHDPSLVEDWRGPDSWRPGPREPVTTLQATVIGLGQALERVAPSTPAARHRYLSAQLHALRFAARRLLGDESDIDQQARDEFGIEFSRVEPHAMDEVRASIAKVLPGSGALAARFEALKHRTTATPDRRGAMMEAALAACRNATAGQLQLPPDERTSVHFASGLSWDGYARYIGGHRSEIEVNADAPLDAARALRLACHEAYPGHHVQQLLIEEALAAHDWPELRLAPGFGPHLLFLEGAAEAGADLAFAAAERAQVYLDLLTAAGLPGADADALARMDLLIPELQPIVTEVARQYLRGGLAAAGAEERLREEALVLNPGATLAMIERRRARALVYGEGRRAILSRLPTRNLHGLRTLFGDAIALQ
jgi:hypothetical protein